jgi:hypothetical protein
MYDMVILSIQYSKLIYTIDIKFFNTNTILMMQINADFRLFYYIIKSRIKKINLTYIYIPVKKFNIRTNLNQFIY